MSKVSRWEIAGVPAALIFSSLHELGVLGRIGLGEHDIPHLMTLLFVIAAVARSYVAKRQKTDR